MMEAKNKDEWWFSVVDVVKALTDSPNPRDYIKKIRSRDSELSEGWGQIVTPLIMGTIKEILLSPLLKEGS